MVLLADDPEGSISIPDGPFAAPSWLRCVRTLALCARGREQPSREQPAQAPRDRLARIGPDEGEDEDVERDERPDPGVEAGRRGQAWRGSSENSPRPRIVRPMFAAATRPKPCMRAAISPAITFSTSDSTTAIATGTATARVAGIDREAEREEEHRRERVAQRQHEPFDAMLATGSRPARARP